MHARRPANFQKYIIRIKSFTIREYTCIIVIDTLKLVIFQKGRACSMDLSTIFSPTLKLVRKKLRDIFGVDIKFKRKKEISLPSISLSNVTTANVLDVLEKILESSCYGKVKDKLETNQDKNEILATLLGSQGLIKKLSDSTFTSKNSNFQRLSGQFSCFNDNKEFYKKLRNNPSKINTLISNSIKYLRIDPDNPDIPAISGATAPDSNPEEGDLKDITDLGEIKGKHYDTAETKLIGDREIGRIKLFIVLVLLYYLVLLYEDEISKEEQRKQSDQQTKETIKIFGEIDEFKKFLNESGIAFGKKYISSCQEWKNTLKVEGYNHAPYIKNEINRIEERMGEINKTLETVNNLLKYFYNPATRFERYLVELCKYYKKKLTSDAELNVGDDLNTQMRITTTDMYNMARSYTASTDKYKLLTNLCSNLETQHACLDSWGCPDFSVCCALKREAELLHDIVESEQYSKSDFKQLEKEKYKTAKTFREFLQVFLNDDRVNKAATRTKERNYLINEINSTTIENGESAARLYYQSNGYTYMKNLLRDRHEGSEDPEEYGGKDNISILDKHIENLKQLIKRTKTTQKIKVYRGIKLSEPRTYDYLARMAPEMITRKKRKCYVGPLQINLNRIRQQLESKKDLIFEEPGFMSTSVSKNVSLKKFTDETTSVMQEITVPEDTPCYAYPEGQNTYSGEKELLFLPGTKLHLKKITVLGGTEDPKTNFICRPQLVTLHFDMEAPTS